MIKEGMLKGISCPRCRMAMKYKSNDYYGTKWQCVVCKFTAFDVGPLKETEGLGRLSDGKETRNN